MINPGNFLNIIYEIYVISPESRKNSTVPSGDTNPDKKSEVKNYKRKDANLDITFKAPSRPITAVNQCAAWIVSGWVIII